MKILIVDDDPDVVEILSYNLLKQKYEVFKATNGNEGLVAVMESSPDLIILDIRMPEMNGIEMCREMKRSEIYSKIPVLFLTADTDEYTMLSAIEAGGDHFITKPVKPKLILDLVEEISKKNVA